MDSVELFGGKFEGATIRAHACVGPEDDDVLVSHGLLVCSGHDFFKGFAK